VREPVQHLFNSSVVSGPETLVLPNLAAGAHRPTILLLSETRLAEGAAKVAKYARDLGLPAAEIPVERRFDRRAIGALAHRLAEAPPKILHTHGPKATLYALLAIRSIAPSLRPRLVTTHHGVRAFDRSWRLAFFARVYERHTIPRCDRCLTVCSSDRALLIDRGIAAEKIAIHLNGIDRPPLSDGKQARAAWELDGFLVGVVGRLSPEKRHREIFEVIRFVRAQRPALPIRLLCFGSGPLERELRAAASSTGIGDRVHFLGYRENVAAELPGLDLVLSLSRTEGLPISLIEAGWAARAVVARGVDGIRDLISDGKSGILVDEAASPAEIAAQVGILAGDPSRAASLGSALHDRVRDRFSRNAWLTRLDAIYEELV
jgi:glycosyltransferase involved in cell wall biosynthesis